MMTYSFCMIPDFGCHNVFLRGHVPRFFQKWEINHCCGVAHRTGIAIPIPDTAKVATALDYPKIFDAFFTESGAHTEPRKASTYHHESEVIGDRLTRFGLKVWVVFHLGEFSSWRQVLGNSVWTNSLASFQRVLLSKSSTLRI